MNNDINTNLSFQEKQISSEINQIITVQDLTKIQQKILTVTKVQNLFSVDSYGVRHRQQSTNDFPQTTEVPSNIGNQLTNQNTYQKSSRNYQQIIKVKWRLKIAKQLKFLLHGKHNTYLFLILLLINLISMYFCFIISLLSSLIFYWYIDWRKIIKNIDHQYELTLIAMIKIAIKISIPAFFCNLFVYVWVISNRNKKYEDSNILILLEMGYIALVHLGFHLEMIYDDLQEKAFIKHVYQKAGIDYDCLYFEFINRETLESIYQEEDFKLSRSFYKALQIGDNTVMQSKMKQMNQFQDQSLKKIWNHFVHIAYSPSKLIIGKPLRHNKHSFIIVNVSKKVQLIGLIAQIIVLVYFMQDRSESKIDFLYVLHTCCIQLMYCFFYSVITQSIFATMEYGSNLSYFTQLIEQQNKIKYFQVNKLLPTINIFCIFSIKAWYEMREIMFKTYSQKNMFYNVFQFIDFFSLSTLGVVIVLDTFGTFWKQGTVVNNQLLLIMCFLNIFQRVIGTLIPICVIFSEINEQFQYNKQQIEQIYTQLTSFKLSYEQFRKNLLTHIRSETNIQSTKKCYENQRQAINLQMCYEIIRNTCLYKGKIDEYNLQQQNFFEFVLCVTSEKDIIQIEKDYLEELISTYEHILNKMQNNELQFQFLGFIQITYGSLSALALTFVSPLIAYLYSLLQDKYEC